MRTLIAITAKRSDSSWISQRVRPYLEALQHCQMDAVVLSPETTHIPWPRLSGLLLTGGEDIHPRHYGESLQGADIHNLDTDRDRFELRLVNAALSKQLPILGICRGSQLLNVAWGGRLHQHIPLHRVASIPDYGYVSHAVEARPDSLLYQLEGRQWWQVNSLHHQNIDENSLHSELKVAATDSEGEVEAIGARRYPWLLGVQWHPERRAEVPSYHSKIFASFATASKRFNHQKQHAI